MRLARLSLLPVLLLPQFLACGEGARTKSAPHVALKSDSDKAVEQLRADDAADGRALGASVTRRPVLGN